MFITIEMRVIIEPHESSHQEQNNPIHFFGSHRFTKKLLIFLANAHFHKLLTFLADAHYHKLLTFLADARFHKLLTFLADAPFHGVFPFPTALTPFHTAVAHDNTHQRLALNPPTTINIVPHRVIPCTTGRWHQFTQSRFHAHTVSNTEKEGKLNLSWTDRRVQSVSKPTCIGLARCTHNIPNTNQHAQHPQYQSARTTSPIPINFFFAHRR
jgi:hypothetical protein